MKNLFRVTTMLIITSLVIVTMNNCNKTNPGSVDIEKSNDQTVLIEKSKTMQEHILAFKTKMEYYRDNPGIKSGGELYTADSAVIELESLLNFNFCYTNIECVKKTFELSEVTMPLDELEKINDPDLMQVYYDKIIDTIQAQMGRVNYSNMKLLLVDLENTGTDSNGDAIVNVGVLIGKEYLSVLHNDNWIYGENLGLCSTGWTNNEDAATQLTVRVTEAMLPDPPSGTIWGFSNPHSSTFSPLDYPLYTSPSDHDNYLDYKVFLAEETTYPEGVVLTIGDDEECLTMYEMDFYKANYIDFAVDLEDQYSQKFSNCMLYGEPETNPYFFIQHYYTIYVGTRYLKYPIDIENILEY